MRRRRQTRLRNFLPCGESLERRIVLSAAIGVNLQPNTQWANDPIWTDLHNLASTWYPAVSGTIVPLSADGYALTNATVGFSTANYPDGTYEFSYAGSATVSFSDVGQLSGPVTTSGGVTTGSVTVNHANGDGNWLYMGVSNINAANPMDDFHLMMPGYGNGTTSEPMFTPAFLQALEPFSEIRFLNWDGANNSTVYSWSQRVSPTSLSTVGAGGVPYEDMIELSNEAQKDMWINIPVEATPQFVQSLAQLISADLDPNLNVYVEYGNENWNSGFTQFQQVLAIAQLNPLVSASSNTLQMVGQQSAYAEVSDAQNFNTAFGSASARVRPILAGWNTGPYYQQYELQFVQQNYGPPAQFIYATAVAPYVYLPSGDNVAGLTLNQLFADMNQDLTTGILPALQSDAAVAQQYGVPLVAYEGGQSLYPGANDLNFSVMQEAQNDPRMYQLYVALMSDWQQVGGGLFTAYDLDGYGSQYGFWGMLPNVVAPGNQKYDALISELYPAGDANFNGIVDDADFSTLAANYGDLNAYWAQGDFDDDGTVNWQDLDILRQNLDPAGFTLSQFAQQALFGQLGTVVPGQSLEYDGYGVTYASSLPVAASSGTVDFNVNTQGTAIVLGGATYSTGLGALANSSISLTLNGQFAQFESTIGVDGSSNTGSSVIFDVYGDGQLLYQSPTVTYASGAIPIALNVTGVTTLTLTMSAAPGSTPSADHAVWADARLISTANFGSTTPYAMTWQLSQNSTVISTQTSDSFVFGALSGTYVLSLTVTDAAGDTATASTTVQVIATAASASPLLLDSHTEGSWIGTYGSQGYDVFGGAVSLPSYATVSLARESTATWAASTSAAPALQVDPGGPFGVAACWYSTTSFTVNVNFTDGQSHVLTLYADDFDNRGRSEGIQIINPATGAVLSSNTISSFTDGIYLQWTVTGNVEIVITTIAGVNAVLSGLFFDPPTTAVDPLRELDGTTQGNWVGTYGTLGYDIIGDATRLPNGVSITPSGQSSYVWSTATAPQAVVNPTGSGRTAAAWYSATSFTVDVDMLYGQSYNVELYLLDYDNGGRSEQIQLTNAATGATLGGTTIANFSGGVYLNWTLSGNVRITFTNEGGASAVLNGLFFDAASSAAIVTPGATAAFVAKNTTTQGNWIGTYGTLGYDVIGNASSLPSGVTVSPSGASTYTWSNPAAPQALQVPGSSSRIAATWYSYTSFTVDVNITNGQSYNLELYLFDYGYSTSSQQLQLTNAATGAVLSTQNVSNLSGGVYLGWTISGDVLITITRTAGNNAVLNGLFLDPAPAAPTSTVTFLTADTTTRGNWIGTYGTLGYDVIGNAVSLPSGVTVTPAGQSPYTWSTATAPQALELTTGTGLIAACWYSATSFTVDVNITNGQSYDLELYLLDYDSKNRSEQVVLSNGTTGAVESTECVSNFASGVYLNWTISVNVLITFTTTGSSSAVLNGFFLDPVAGAPATTSTANFLVVDRMTQGNWIGTYGTLGYDVIGKGASLPSGVSVAGAGYSSYTWNGATAPQALQDPTDSGRIAACWYSATSFTLDVNITNGQSYNLELYLLDYGYSASSQQIQLASGAGGAVMSTENVSNVSGGVYLNWTISGNVLITITRTAGNAAVLNGLFLDPVVSSENSAAATATFVAADRTSQGNWIGTYGTLGYDVIGKGASLPSGVSVNADLYSSYTWNGATAPQALQDPTDSGRIAACWYSYTSFTVDVNITNGQSYNLELYLLDYNYSGSSQQIQFTSVTTGAVLSTESISNLSAGVHLSWTISGNVLITITRTAGNNAVLNGLFLDPAPTTA